MADTKLFLRPRLAAAGAEDLFYSSKADGSADGPVDYFTMTGIIESLLSTTFAASTHTHVLSDITDAGSLAGLDAVSNGNWSGADLAITNGGTGASTVADARANLGVYSTSEVDSALAAFVSYTDEAVRDAIGTALVAGPNITITPDDGANTIIIAASAGGTLSDGDKGDITVSASGTIWTIDNGSVSLSKIANAAASARLVGSGTGGAGSAYSEIGLGSGVQISGSTLKGADYYSQRLVSSPTNGSDVTFPTSGTSYLVVGNFTFGIDLDTFLPTHFRLFITNCAASAGTITAQLIPSSSATSPLHVGGDDLAISGGAANRDSGWRTFDNPNGLTGFQILSVAIKSSSGTPSLTLRSIEIHFKR
jgi:hypothetical protein